MEKQNISIKDNESALQKFEEARKTAMLLGGQEQSDRHH